MTGTDASAAPERGSHLVWRVRLLFVSGDEIVVEHPCALGRPIPLEAGAPLLAIISIGQNRWTFTTRTLTVNAHDSSGRGSPAPTPATLRLAAPDSVKRCQRRAHDRLEIAPLTLPEVELWPLLDPRSVVVAERAHQIQHEIELGRLSDESSSPDLGGETMMPEVGPRFRATLLNLGGGGLGLRVRPDDSQALVRHKVFWMRFMLPPAVSTPICATGKLAHTHIESNHDTYAGFAFDFTFNPGHQKFVVEQICRYVELQQQKAQPLRCTA